MGQKDKNQQIIIKICCVLVAFSLWLYTTSVLNPIRTYKKNIPVTIVNQEALKKSNLALIPNQNFFVTLNLRGAVNDIYSAKENQFKIELDLHEYILRKGENNIPVYIKKSPENVKVTNSESLWVKVNLDELIEQKFPLRVKIKGKAKEDYYPLGVDINTKNILVKGPSEYVKLVHDVYVDVDMQDATKDFQLKLPIKVIDKNGYSINQLDILPKLIKANVSIRKIKDVDISIKTKGKLKDDKEIKSITPLPNKISIVGNEKLINNIKTIDTEPIDLSKISNDSEINAKLNIPKGITIINNNGFIKIELIINKKKNNINSKKEIIVPIKAENLSNDYSANLERDKISLFLTGDNEFLDKLNPQDIQCYVDLKSLKEGEHSIPVKFKIPNKLDIVSISKQQIIVNIKKNENSEDEYVNTNK